jgi:hypothetical protein
VRARVLSREAEVVVTVAHAVYKEHMVLLIDCLTMWGMDKQKCLEPSKRAWSRQSS